MAPAAFEDAADLRVIVLQAPHVLAFSIGMMTDATLEECRPRGRLRERAPLCARDSVTCEHKGPGESNTRSINVHEITQLGIGARHLPADEVGRASRDESQAISFINAGLNRLASLEVCGHLRRERSRTTRSAPAWWTTAAPAI